MKQVFTLWLLLSVPVLAARATCTLPAPTGLKSQNVTSCDFLFKWNAVTGAVSYTIQYKLSTESTWTVLTDVGNVTSYTITGLSAGSTYNIKVAALCANLESGTYSTTLNVNTVVCSKPTNLTVSNIESFSATISWTAPCGGDKFKLKFRVQGGNWTTIPNIQSLSYNLTGLQANTGYQVKLQNNCDNGNSAWTSVVSFTTLQTTEGPTDKNVLLVIIDDARYDSYAATGGPSFFNDVHISRIANEGVNFKAAFPVLSMCGPSRASLMTGVYPHIHGQTDNPDNGLADTLYLKTIAQILQDNGYYTGLIGKYHLSKFPQPGFNYWMECSKNDYFDAKYNVNGKDKKIFGHQTDIVTDSAIAFLNRVPENKPFFLWLGYRAPHVPYESRPEDDGDYADDEMPFPSNYEEYTENYPAFLYDCHNAKDSAVLVEDYRGYFEMLAGVEYNLGRVWAEMESLNILDSTLIIFMSDNGYMMGEHHLSEKQLSYEESMQIPLFMRYPKLITAGKIVKKQIALNIDVPVTILDFAGIEDTFGMQGVSLLKLMKNEVERKEMLYEFYNKLCVPDIRAVRSLDYKYVTYNCDQVTEEFFDLNEDEQENVNLINDPDFDSLIQVYRDKLDYWRTYYEDFSYDSMYACSLTNPQRLTSTVNGSPFLLHVFPNPSSTTVTVHYMSGSLAPATLSIINALGQIVKEVDFSSFETEFTASVGISSLPPGNYFAVVEQAGIRHRNAFIVE